MAMTTFFALERNVVAVSAAMFLLALGENLWQKFLPMYLQALFVRVLERARQVVGGQRLRDKCEDQQKSE
ncbi:MAG TPA: hypothetical protein VEO54_05335 [Thermoanaerobaculia bacterium]|nr:hypothetical protein [Thermoanaerobaculia bacterium]